MKKIVFFTTILLIILLPYSIVVKDKNGVYDETIQDKVEQIVCYVINRLFKDEVKNIFFSIFYLRFCNCIEKAQGIPYMPHRPFLLGQAKAKALHLPLSAG